MQNVTFKYTRNTKVDLMWGCQNFNILWKTWNYNIFFDYSEIKLEISNKWEFSSVQWLSCIRIFVTPWTAACQASLSITNSWSLLKLMSIELVLPSNHLSSSCRPLLLTASVFLSGSLPRSQFFASGGESIGVFSFSISPYSEYSEVISFRIDWFDLAVQGTLKSLLQHHSSKASILWCSAFFFFIVQLSHPYMTTGKTIALTWRMFVGKAISLLFNILSRLVIGFLSRSRESFNFMAAVTICGDFGAPQDFLSLFPLFPHLFAVKWWN